MKEEFSVYKGLQKPLVFKTFKGKFIGWGLGSILAGLLLCLILSSLINLLTGILTLITISGGGLSITAIQQKKRLHARNRYTGIFIQTTNYHRHDQNQIL